MSDFAPSDFGASESKPRSGGNLWSTVQVLIGCLLAAAGGFGFFIPDTAEKEWVLWVAAALLALGVSVAAGGLCGIFRLRFRWIVQFLLFAILFGAASQIGGSFISNRWVAEESRLWQEAMNRIQQRDPDAMSTYYVEIPSVYHRPETADFQEYCTAINPQAPMEMIRYMHRQLRKQGSLNEPQTMTLKACEERIAEAIELAARRLETPVASESGSTEAFVLDNGLGVVLAKLVRDHAVNDAVAIASCIQLAAADEPIKAEPFKLEIARAFVKSKEVQGWEDLEPLDYEYRPDSPESRNLWYRTWTCSGAFADDSNKHVFALSQSHVDPPKDAEWLLHVTGTIGSDGAVVPFDGPSKANKSPQYILLHHLHIDWRIRLLDKDGNTLYEAELRTSADLEATYTIRPDDPDRYFYLLTVESAIEQLCRELARAIGVPPRPRTTVYSIAHDNRELD